MPSFSKSQSNHYSSYPPPHSIQPPPSPPPTTTRASTIIGGGGDGSTNENDDASFLDIFDYFRANEKLENVNIFVSSLHDKHLFRTKRHVYSRLKHISTTNELLSSLRKLAIYNPTPASAGFYHHHDLEFLNRPHLYEASDLFLSNNHHFTSFRYKE